MIAIPNISKPKFCKCDEYNCFAWDDEKYKCKITEWKKPCPLIEIVTCGECKHCEKRETAKHILINYCEAHGISILDTDYCNWGERRADDNTIKANK